jgi:hypothetical protein
LPRKGVVARAGFAKRRHRRVGLTVAVFANGMAAGMRRTSHRIADRDRETLSRASDPRSSRAGCNRTH